MTLAVNPKILSYPCQFSFSARNKPRPRPRESHGLRFRRPGISRDVNGLTPFSSSCPRRYLFSYALRSRLEPSWRVKRDQVVTLLKQHEPEFREASISAVFPDLPTLSSEREGPTQSARSFRSKPWMGLPRSDDAASVATSRRPAMAKRHRRHLWGEIEALADPPMYASRGWHRKACDSRRGAGSPGERHNAILQPRRSGK
jgi:hypothetical protein